MFMAAMSALYNVITVHGKIEKGHKLLVAFMTVHDGFSFFVESQVIVHPAITFQVPRQRD